MLQVSKKKLSVLAAVLAQVAMVSSVFAGNAATLQVNGLFPSFDQVSATSLFPNTGTQLDLSTVFGAPVKIGTIAINSNDALGFHVTLTTTNTFQLRKLSGYSAGQGSTFLDYTINLINQTGTLSATPPTLTNIGSATGALNFSGTALAPSNVNYDVMIVASQKSLVPASGVSGYQDTITFTLAGN